MLAALEEARFLEEVEVQAALIDCARICTPNLTLCVLLRAAISAPDAQMSPDQYTKLACACPWRLPRGRQGQAS